MRPSSCGRCSIDHERADHELDITDIADRLCRRVEEIAPDVVSSLLHIDADGLIHPLGGPSLPEDYSRALEGVAIGPDIGSCGSSAFYGEPVLATDLDTDPRWQPFKKRPLEAGLRACWSTPIKGKDARVLSGPSPSISGSAARPAAANSASSMLISAGWRSRARKHGPRSRGSPITIR